MGDEAASRQPGCRDAIWLSLGAESLNSLRGGATEMLKGGASLWKERRRSSEHQKHISEGLDSLLVYVEGSWAPERGEHLPEVTHR